MSRYDVAIIGAGMAGASLAAEVAPHASVLLLEAEAQPGYHATGRSAAFWTETYGGPAVQPLTTASHDMLAHPPPGFIDVPLLSPRGAIHLADAEGLPALDAFAAEFAGTPVRLERLDRSALEARVPGLRAGWDWGVAEPSTADIDVAALHAAYLRAARRAGAELRCAAPLAAVRRDGGLWRGEGFAAAVLVDAAGAWADAVAALAGVPPLGIRPYRRTLSQLRVSPAPPVDLPLILDSVGRFYAKAQANGRIWLSPHDETAAPPGDAAPDELDVARAIARMEEALDWRVERVEHSWAGLRSFASDRLPVYGFDPAAKGFFWFAGQGGFGIQTAPAAAKLAAALLLGKAPDEDVARIDPATYSPDRFRLI